MLTRKTKRVDYFGPLKPELGARMAFAGILTGRKEAHNEKNDIMACSNGPCALSGLVTLSSGCRKELCYNHDEHAYSVKVDVTATWEREWERDHGRGWKNTWEGTGMEQLDDDTTTCVPKYPGV